MGSSGLCCSALSLETVPTLSVVVDMHRGSTWCPSGGAYIGHEESQGALQSEGSRVGPMLVPSPGCCLSRVSVPSLPSGGGGQGAWEA